MYSWVTTTTSVILYDIVERATTYVEEKPGKAAIVKDRVHLMCCERLKWMPHDHVIKGVQDFVSEAWHYQLSCCSYCTQ